MSSSKDTHRRDSAIIIPFPRPLPRKRGRPKSAHAGNDTGTPELVMKRLRGETAETLDLCLERGILSARQHWCGVHLRWLHTLRNGAPGVRTIDLTHISGIEQKVDDPQWCSAREKEYHDAVRTLHTHGCAPLLLSVCIFNERPAFLSQSPKATLKRSAEANEVIEALRDGLDILVKLWGR